MGIAHSHARTKIGWAKLNKAIKGLFDNSNSLDELGLEDVVIQELQRAKQYFSFSFGGDRIVIQDRTEEQHTLTIFKLKNDDWDNIRIKIAGVKNYQPDTPGQSRLFDLLFTPDKKLRTNHPCFYFNEKPCNIIPAFVGILRVWRKEMELPPKPEPVFSGAIINPERHLCNWMGSRASCFHQLRR